MFDARTKEITGGVLAETAPIDTSADRFRRNFARLAYSGRGILLRSDQRGESTREAVVFGAAKKAKATFGAKSCLIPNELLWEQGTREEQFRFPTDEGFFEFLRHQCRWEIAFP